MSSKQMSGWVKGTQAREDTRQGEGKHAVKPTVYRGDPCYQIRAHTDRQAPGDGGVCAAHLQEFTRSRP